MELEERMKSVESELAMVALMQEQNTKNIAVLTGNISSLVQLQTSIQGAVTVGRSVQNFLAWIIKWPVIGAGAYAIIKYIKEFF